MLLLLLHMEVDFSSSHLFHHEFAVIFMKLSNIFPLIDMGDKSMELH